ncbi:hypothetical protein OJAV_G00154790 [Oryzias javanicus]|uniref:Uncharacterized protein n=1 Tax=Oryzias javanicus TaxID=123683 RepID=A0A3S2NY79_ORYJA|nr:hypothetical protein OJAV_G00154790 [Oryzias javanicus]
MFDPALIVDLNSTSERVVGERKYPALHLSGADTGEMFGLEYAEPETRPEPPNWDKHKSRSEPAATETPHPPSGPLTPSSELVLPTLETPAGIFQFSSQLADSPVEDQTVQLQTKMEDAAPSPSVCTIFSMHWTHKDWRESLCVGPFCSHEGGH